MTNSQLSTYNSQLGLSEYIEEQSFESIRNDSEELVKLLVSIVKTAKGTRHV